MESIQATAAEPGGESRSPRRRRASEGLLKSVFLACAFTAVVSIVVIFVFVGIKGLPIFGRVGVVEFIFGRVWYPTEGQFGIWPMIVGSFVVTLGALAIGAPLAIATAIFLSEVASKEVKAVMRPAVELLAGIPSVVYGLIGIVVLVPLVRSAIPGPGFGFVAGWLVLAIMILPTIAAISEDSIAAVPRSFRESSFALGATRWQTIWRVVLPACRSGIVNAVVLGMGRAVGETMAVLMVVGNAPVLPASLSGSVRTLTSAIALDMSYASGDHQVALFAMGIALLVVSMVLIALIRVMPFKEVYR